MVAQVCLSMCAQRSRMPVRARVFFSRGRYNGVRAVQRDVDAFLQWYNRERPHQGHANRGLTPAERMRELGCPA